MNTKYLERNIDKALAEWKKSSEHKPILLRGARQVGKTSAVRNLGKTFENYVEIDLHLRQDLHAVFNKMKSPQQLCEELSLLEGFTFKPGKTLFFIDEIQDCPAAIGSLRYFYEQYPELHVIAAGSLLEFALEELPSFGVGRIHSLYMYPFCFSEFLQAMDNAPLAAAVSKASPSNPLSDVVHNKLLQFLRAFMIIGGMPAVVKKYVETNSFVECQKILAELITAYRDDFAKYRRRIPSSRIDAVFMSVAAQTQGKFMFSKVDGVRTEQAQAALQTLILAGLVYPVTHTAANGIPLGAETDERCRRMIMFDTGLLQRVLNLDLKDIILENDVNFINKGPLAEVFVGCEFVKNMPADFPAALYCWQRDKKGSDAEIDYLVQSHNQILPVEVKSGKTGKMQSLRIFMSQKKSPFGIRTSLENFCEYQDIKVYPLYAAGNIVRG